MDFLNEETPKKILTEPLAIVTEKMTESRLPAIAGPPALWYSGIAIINLKQPGK